MAEAESLVRELLTGFLSAFAISTGVSLFIVPISSRTVVQKEHAGYVQGIRGALKVGSSIMRRIPRIKSLNSQ
jgi:hypothetical protein